MSTLWLILKNLREIPAQGKDLFNVAIIPGVTNHKIGVTSEGRPIFFIRSVPLERNKYIDCNLEFISVKFNKKCKVVVDRSMDEEGIYTIIIAKTDSPDMQRYFVDIVHLLVKNLPQEPNIEELKRDIDRLIDLFGKLSNPSRKSIQGLWAELLVIERSSNPEYLIKSWHSQITSKYDFNDGRDKIEVKSTSKSRRVHSFASDQLLTNVGSKLIIVSVLTIETGIGKNIHDLVSAIEKKIQDESLHFRLHEVILQSLGNDLDRSFDIYYDYEYAINNLKCYNSLIIPKILEQNIPTQITNIKYDIDLTGISSISRIDYASLLHNSILK